MLGGGEEVKGGKRTFKGGGETKICRNAEDPLINIVLQK